MPELLTLNGKTGLVVGIANDKSIAWGCARAFHEAGASLAATYLNARAEGFVRPLAESLGCDPILPCDVEREGELEAVFAAIKARYGRLDFLLHSIAYAPLADLHGRVADCSREGFARAMDVSCHSFIRMAQLAEPLMAEGGSLMTVSYFGSERVVPGYNLMGPVKAALECTVRYLAHELGPKGIRVNALSAGPIMTRAASGISHFDRLVAEARAEAPLGRTVTPEDVGHFAAFLASDLAAAITGHTHYIDAGQEIID